MKIIEIARFVEDVPAAITFYRRLLGVEPSYTDTVLATFQSHGVTYLIHQRYEPGPDDLPCEDHIAFGVADVDLAAASLEQQGLQISYPPRDYDWGRSAYLREPNGTLMELTQISPKDSIFH
jgi:predicted enzyme related to lactoylglutathione lyase